MNKALGAKILWHLVLSGHAWHKSIILKEYLTPIHFIILDKPWKEQQGSCIWELCKTSTFIFKENLTWVGNGRKIIYAMTKSWKEPH